MDSLLKYAQRFYKRQFIDRKPFLGVTVTKFNEHLNEYFKDENLFEKGLPTVNYMAAQFSLSPKYLSDVLKQETGKTALDLIHLRRLKMQPDFFMSQFYIRQEKIWLQFLRGYNKLDIQ